MEMHLTLQQQSLLVGANKLVFQTLLSKISLVSQQLQLQQSNYVQLISIFEL